MFLPLFRYVDIICAMPKARHNSDEYQSITNKQLIILNRLLICTELTRTLDKYLIRSTSVIEKEKKNEI
jgi:hypothetical protein